MRLDHIGGVKCTSDDANNYENLRIRSKRQNRLLGLGEKENARPESK